VASSDQGRRRKRETKTGFSESSRIYNTSLELIDKDESEAFRLNYIAAQTGMHDAVLAMGWFYLNGVGVEADEQAAVHWYKKAARQGDSRAMYSLGEIAYFNEEYSEALTWFERAASNGHQRSTFWLGKMYWRGEGVAKSQKAARDCFARAASGKVLEAGRVLRYLAFLSKKTHQR